MFRRRRPPACLFPPSCRAALSCVLFSVLLRWWRREKRRIAALQFANLSRAARSSSGRRRHQRQGPSQGPSRPGCPGPHVAVEPPRTPSTSFAEVGGGGEGTRRRRRPPEELSAKSRRRPVLSARARPPRSAAPAAPPRLRRPPSPPPWWPCSCPPWSSWSVSWPWPLKTLHASPCLAPS